MTATGYEIRMYEDIHLIREALQQIAKHLEALSEGKQVPRRMFQVPTDKELNDEREAMAAIIKVFTGGPDGRRRFQGRPRHVELRDGAPTGRPQRDHRRLARQGA
jgi:hypothetical protein